MDLECTELNNIVQDEEGQGGQDGGDIREGKREVHHELVSVLL